VEAKTGDADTKNKVGLDNGKVCPTGPQYIIPASFDQTVNLAGTGASIDCTLSGLVYICQLNIATSLNSVLQYLQVGQRASFANAGTGQFSSGSTCAADEKGVILDDLYSDSVYLTAVDTSSIADHKFVNFNAPWVCSGAGGVGVASSFSILYDTGFLLLSHSGVSGLLRVIPHFLSTMPTTPWPVTSPP